MFEKDQAKQALKSTQLVPAITTREKEGKDIRTVTFIQKERKRKNEKKRNKEWGEHRRGLETGIPSMGSVFVVDTETISTFISDNGDDRVVQNRRRGNNAGFFR